MDDNLASNQQTDPPSVGLFAGHLEPSDSDDGDNIVGWAIDRSDPETFIQLTLIVDGVVIRKFVADIYRGDLFNAGVGNGRHGFSEPLPKRLFDGQLHEIVVRFVNGEILSGCPRTIDLKKYVVDEVRGFTDNINSREITGWVIDSKSPQDPLKVELLVDGRVMGETFADNARDDLKQAGIGNGRHAFRFNTPLSILDDELHHVAVRVHGTEFILSGSTEFRAKHERRYKTFEEYLRWAIYYKEIHPPFGENDKLVIAEMLWLSSHYEKKFADSDRGALISIIMPTFNRASLIREAINSIANQVYTNWELIIVDDCSTDGTERIVQTYADSRVRYIRCRTNSGPAHARSIGMQSALGDYFCYLDSDNTWDPRYLDVMLNVLKNTPGASSIYCAQVVHHIQPDQQHKKVIRFSPFSRSQLENANYIDLNCFLHKRQLFEELGGFRNDMRMLEDWELLIRYTRTSFPVSLPCLLSHYFVGKSKEQVTFGEDYSIGLRKILETCATAPFSFEIKDNPDQRLILPIFSHLFYGTGAPIRPYLRARFVSIIIPSYEAGEYLELCLASLIRFTPMEWFEVIIVDNASIGSVLSVLGRYATRENIKIIYNSENFGYSFAINQGIQAARPDSDVIFFNSDIAATAGWLEALWEVLDVVPDAALVVPRQTLPPGTDTMQLHVPCCNTILEVDVNLSAHHNNVIDPNFDERRGLVQLSFAAFFCVYVKRECIDNVGVLDDRNGRHYRSDAIYSDVVQYLSGGKMIYTPHSKLYHFLQRATSALKELDKEMYQLMFEQNSWKIIDPLRGIL